MKRRLMLAVLVVAVAAVTLWRVEWTGDKAGTLTREEVAGRAAQLKADMKADLAAQGKRYEPGAFPSGWGYNQRAYPYDVIDYDQLKQAVAEAQALRFEARKGAAPLTGSWVEEGPSNIGARVADMAFHPTNSNIIYAAMASGGVFRSTDGGSTWDPISDDLPVLTIGAVAIDPQTPSTIYVGTGEANAHSFSWFGMGMYKSTDNGANWSYIGLEETRYIARIVVDPMDTDRIWVAGTGSLFGTNPERGIYRSLDGGSSWDLNLSVSDSTAGTDVAIDPTRPDTVFAAMWERHRGLTYRRSSGVTSGIYRSYDGGDTWAELTSGLPSGPEVGRIGLSVCASSPNVIYAIYDIPADYPDCARVYKSTNGGNTWTRTNDGDIGDIHSSFGWYFGQVRVDPADPDRVFALGVPFYRSQNGGSSWSQVGSGNHVDHHAMIFDPNDHTRIFEGNDGGIYRSTNSGTSWTKLYDQPTNQFYAIGIDYLNPNRLYGGTQDNGTLRTPTGGTSDWEHILGGDGFYSIVDPTDSDIIYAEYQYGYLYKSVDDAYSWDYVKDGIDDGDRTNWMTPVVMDPSDHLKLYYGSHRVYKTTDGAGWWDPISGDLTNGDQGGGFGTITTIAVSPVDAAVIYVGTDDSNVWVTQNGGTNWTNISSSLPNRWVTRVAVDPASPGTAYVTFSGLRWDENIGYVYRTEDYGASWTDITENLPGAPVNAIVVDPDQPSRLYVGTDVGCYYTEVPGAEWSMLGTGLPAVPVFDLKLHNPTRTLVAGTHGRSMHSYDLTTLPDVSGVDVADQGIVSRFTSYPNPFSDATTISFVLSRPSWITLDVYDLAGRKVKTVESQDMGSGTQNLRWDGTNDEGRRVASGVYYMRLETGAGVKTKTVNLVK
jgi:photosystem II stability/assembly factor-like uncharacterized protein